MRKTEDGKTAQEDEKMRSYEAEEKGLPSQLPNLSSSYSPGFTLIEVIIAIAILGISLVLVMQLFAGGLRAARTSCDYSRAVIHAKEKMGEVMEDPVQDSGTFDDGYKWEAEVQPYKELEDSPFKMVEVKVRVLWADVTKNPRTVELVGLKTISSENEEEL